MKVFKSLKNSTQNKLIGYSFFAPWIIGYVLFTLYPVIMSIIISFNDVQFRVTGIKFDFHSWFYYNHAFNIDATFKLDLVNSITFIVGLLPVVLVFSLIFALFLNQEFPGKTLFRAIFFMPVVIMSGPVASALLDEASVDFTQTIPAIFTVTEALPSALKTPCLFVIENIDLVFWLLGVQMLIYLVGIQKINVGIYEAASIDGAGAWEKFWKITLPNLLPYILLNAVYTIMELSNYSENAINKKIIDSLFDSNMIYSLSSAMSWVYFLCIVVLLLLIFGLFILLTRRQEREKSN